MEKTFTLKAIADHIGGTLVGDPDCIISSPGAIDQAEAGQIAFAEKGAALKKLSLSKASAVIVPMGVTEGSASLIQVTNPRLAFSLVLQLFCPPCGIDIGVHPSATIGDRCQIGDETAIGAGVVIGHDVTIGDRVIVHPNVSIGDNVTVGDDSVIHPNTAVLERSQIGKRVIIHSGSVIGSDGFGFVFDAGRHHKIPQIGIVQIDDDVEIGANNAIDRATLGRTWIKAGTKTDNLVHIAHNVEIGEHSVITAQVGFAGSTTAGRYLVVAGQAGIGGHLKLGDGVTIGPQCGVAQSVPDKQTVSGTTLAMPHGAWLRLQKVLQDVPKLFKRVSEIEKKLSNGLQEKK